MLELFNEVEHLRDEFGGARLVRGRKAPETQHVLLHCSGEFVGEFLRGDAALGGALDDLVVDVGDVAHERDGVTACLKPAAHDVEGDKGAAVADVGVVVDRDAADVHADLAGFDGRKRADVFAERRIDLKGHCVLSFLIFRAACRIP